MQKKKQHVRNLHCIQIILITSASPQVKASGRYLKQRPLLSVQPVGQDVDLLTRWVFPEEKHKDRCCVWLTILFNVDVQSVLMSVLSSCYISWMCTNLAQTKQLKALGLTTHHQLWPEPLWHTQVQTQSAPSWWRRTTITFNEETQTAY